MFTLTSNISIGSLQLSSVQDVHIRKSMYSLSDTATIVIPASARLKVPSEMMNTDSMPSATLFNEGDKVQIALGYDSNNQTEFTGFVKSVQFTTPCEVVCEGYSYLLGAQKLFTYSKEGVSTIKEILQLITAGTEIEVATTAPEINITLYDYEVRGKSGKEILEQLKKQTGLLFYFDGNVLHTGVTYRNDIPGEVIYKLGYNTLEEQQLKYRSAEHTALRLLISYKDLTGRTQYTVTGSSGSQVKEIRLNKGVYTDMALLQAQAKAYIYKYLYPGYEGRITSFLLPIAQPGQAASIQDEVFPERSGLFLIESTEVLFGQQGARRIITPGFNLKAIP